MFYLTVNDFDDWRTTARALLKRRIAPKNVDWQTDKQASLFSAADDFMQCDIVCPSPTISRDFFNLAKSVACYRDDSRWALLYSVAWRILFEDRHLLSFKIDPQIASPVLW